LKRVPSDLVNLIPSTTVSSGAVICGGVMKTTQSPPLDASGKKKTVRFQSA
jgi:hypothetical protein